MLILLETAAQARWTAKNHYHQEYQGEIVAITPVAAYTCQQLGLRYIKLEDVTRLNQRAREYEPILCRFLSWEKQIDIWAQQAIPDFGQIGFLPMQNCSWLFFMLFAEIWSTTICLHELIENLKPDGMTLWSPIIQAVPPHIHPSVSSMPVLAPSIAHLHGLRVIDLSMQNPELAPISNFDTLPPPSIATELKTVHYTFYRLKRWIASLVKQQPTMLKFVVVHKKQVRDMLKPISSDFPHVLFSGYGYDLQPFIEEFHRRGVRVTVLSDWFSLERLFAQSHTLPPALQCAMNTAGAQLLQESFVWEPLEAWGLERIPLWSEPIRFWWHALVPELWIHFQYVASLLKQKQITALVTWDTTGSTLSSAVVNAATQAQIPCTIYQHGGTSGFDAKVYFCFLRHNLTFLAYGQGTVEELDQSCPDFLRPLAQVIPVGSTRLERLHRQKDNAEVSRIRAELHRDDHRPIILYIPTCFGTYGRAISELSVYPEVSYFELLQQVLSIWNEFPTVRLLYKDFIIANDLNRIMPDFIRKHIPNGTVTCQRLTDVMWAVDAIVVDHAITALGEVLLTNKPLVVYMPMSHIVLPQARTLLSKRATVAATPEDFQCAVRSLLQVGHYTELDQPNTEFLQMYCTYLNDGQSACRAADAVLERNHL